MTSVRPEVTILLIRHGEQVRQGDDGPLSERGVQQAALVAQAVEAESIDHVVSSTLRRAVDTAAALGGGDRAADLDEFRFGASWSWEDSDNREDQALWQPHHRVGEGESLATFERRVRAAMSRLIQFAPEGRLVLVTHSGVIDALLRWAFGCEVSSPWLAEVPVSHASITELRHWPLGVHEQGAPRHTELVRLNNVTHLPPDLVTGL